MFFITTIPHVIYSIIRERTLSYLEELDNVISEYFKEIKDSLVDLSDAYTDNKLNVNYLVEMSGGGQYFDHERYTKRIGEYETDYTEINHSLHKYSQKVDELRSLMYKMYDLATQFVKINQSKLLFQIYMCNVIIDSSGFGNEGLVPNKYIFADYVETALKHLKKINKLINANDPRVEKLENYHTHTISRLIKFCNFLFNCFEESNSLLIDVDDPPYDTSHYIEISESLYKDEFFLLSHFILTTYDLYE